MEFLSKIGISDDVIKKIGRLYNEDVLNNAKLDERKIITSIIFLRRIGVNCIDKILLNYLPFLSLGEKKMIMLMEEDSSIEETVDKINNNYKYVEVLNSK